MIIEEYQPQFQKRPQEQGMGVVTDDSLSLKLSEDEFLRMLDAKIETSRSYFSEYLDWRNKMELAENIWLAKQLDEEEMYPWQLPYVDPIIFRSIETIIPIAVSRIPTPEAAPAQDSDRSRKLAQDLEDALTYRFRQEKMRSKFRTSTRHLLLYLLGVIKGVWDPRIGLNGDFTFKSLRPQQLYAFDHTTADPREMEYIVELVTEPISIIINKFPKKRAELFEKLGVESILKEDKKITYQEVWFTYYTKNGEPQEGVLWRYEDIVLDKMKNPNWDWGGEDTELLDQFGEPYNETIYRNFLERPWKPYVFLNYLNLGKQIVDDTSLLFQAWLLQQNVNKRGMQITEMADKAQGKLAISTDFMPSDEAERVTDDPNEHLVGEGDARAGIQHVPGTVPPPALFQDKTENTAAIDNLMGTHSTTRGERGTQETATGRMLLREGDYGRIDDLVQEAIENAAYDCFQLAAQFMKLRYTEPHFIKVSGRDGTFDFQEFSSDSIEDGVEVYVRAGSSLPVDKLSKRNEAIQLIGQMAPDDLFDRLGWDDPTESALKLLTYQTNPQIYAQILATGDKFKEYWSQGMGQGMAPQGAAAAQVPPEGGLPTAGGAAPEEGAAVAEASDALARLEEFAQSPQYQELPDERKQEVIDQMRALNEQIKQVGGAQQ